MTNLTSQLGVAVHNEDDDHPEAAPAYGAGGWTKDGKWALIYDRYDIWAVSPEGTPPRKLTDGRKSELQFRVSGWITSPEEERGIDISKHCCCAPKIWRPARAGFIRCPVSTRSPKSYSWAPRITGPSARPRTPT